MTAAVLERDLARKIAIMKKAHSRNLSVQSTGNFIKSPSALSAQHKKILAEEGHYLVYSSKFLLKLKDSNAPRQC